MNNIFAKDTRTEMYSSNLGRIGEQFGVSRTTSPSSMRAAIYCRLSKDDGDFDSDSSSIQTQRDMLEHHCSQQGWEVTAVYQDDGFTGLNMNRPDLQRMLKAVERRQIDVIITKDLSRLSRNYIEIGQLMEEFFPKNSVRYVALNDGVDSDKEGSSDMTPFRAVMKSMR